MSNWHAQKTYTETPHGKGSPDVFTGEPFLCEVSDVLVA